MLSAHTPPRGSQPLKPLKPLKAALMRQHLFLIFYILDVISLFSFLRGQVCEWSTCSFWFDTVPAMTMVHKSTDIKHFCEHGGIY